MLPDLLPSLPAPYVPENHPPQRICDFCRINLMEGRHDATCPRAPRIDDVLRLATNPADARAEVALVRCHRRAVKAWLASGRSL